MILVILAILMFGWSFLMDRDFPGAPTGAIMRFAAGFTIGTVLVQTVG